MFNPTPRLCATLIACLACSTSATSQQSTLPSEGVAERSTRHIALVNARVVSEPGRVIESATITLRDGKIVSVTVGEQVPQGAERRDLGGKTVFPGFIDVTTSLGLPDALKPGGIKGIARGANAPHRQTGDQPGTPHWNRHVRPEISAADHLQTRSDEVAALRKLGFAAAQTLPQTGVIRGQGALLLLRDSTRSGDLLLARDTSQHVAFDFAYGGEYPGSLMGAIALIRQSLYDARWYHAASNWRGRTPIQRPEPDAALAALHPAATGAQRVFFQLDDEADVGRVARLRQEFELDLVMLGTGHEYRVLPQARTAQSPFVLPLAFPEAPAVENAETALNIALAELEHWEQAPANPGRVAAAGIDIAFTTRGLKEPEKHFWANVRRAVRAGLSETDALRALTTTPATLVREDARLGRIAPGRLANLVVADAGLFRDDGARVFEVWVEGQRHEMAPLSAADATGEWQLQWADGQGPTRWTAKRSGEQLDIAIGETHFKSKLEGEKLLALAPRALFTEGAEGTVALTARIHGDMLEGYRDLADGRRVRFTGTRVAAGEKDTPKAAKPTEAIPAFQGYPAGEYRRLATPERAAVLLIQNATLWTNTEQGIIERGDLLVRDGRIVAVGAGLDLPAGATRIDASGLHLTPGLIDAHSHTAIARNVNEPSHAVTTEVRIGDVLDPTDINIYRQLAGGLTSANLLHGSANPMGGQNAVIKLRWGETADGLLLQGATPGVKFALGENVKQSNWGDAMTTRYPQTRMGVEQIMRDHFNAARVYAKDRSRTGRDVPPQRRDLRLDALAEIVAGTRQIHIHSYRQDEITMFARLAAEYGIPGVTFQHVLEGYKSADAINSINAGASTFTDWWGFKMEVWDAIGHNASLMARTGVVTSLNSDSNELARRLNSEAAKAVAYGGIDEQEALKMVTLNPARQLALAHRLGALAPGYDADFVLWSAPPLSNYARAESTWIDGRTYFDLREDRAEQARILAERERLITKALGQRAATLSLHTSTESKPADGTEQQRPTAQVPDAGWQSVLAPTRTLYHNGADLLSCGLHDHAH
ncbi:amidohydrolase family protein [Xanthomonadaceae bacterium XH05]|nr:amidohydrolase family protein [Xanthomonadaceae bacterium XH05]